MRFIERLGRHRIPEGPVCSWTGALILSGVCSTAALGQVSEGWDVRISTELVYNVVVDM